MRYPLILRAGTWLVAVFALVLTACDQQPTDSATLVGMEIAASSGGWNDKVTAGGDAIAWATEFSFSAAASSNDTDTWGEMQYSRSDLEFHADVACLWVQSDLQRAAIAGPVETVQVGTAGGPYVWVTLKEGGTSSGDELRVVFESTLPTESEHCGVSSTTPGVYTDGNVNIRSK